MKIKITWSNYVKHEQERKIKGAKRKTSFKPKPNRQRSRRTTKPSILVNKVQVHKRVVNGAFVEQSKCTRQFFIKIRVKSLMFRELNLIL